MTSEHTLTTLNSLLRGEIAAVETYQQAFAKLGDDPMTLNLRQIHVDHREAANELRQHLHSHGGKPEQGSGVWGAFAKVFEGTAKTFGATTAIKALKEGEEHGKADYQEALRDAGLPEECKTLIASKLLPQTESHIAALHRLLA